MQIEKYLNKIHCEDALSFMAKLSDKSVDLCLTDPPYGIGLVKTKNGNWGIDKNGTKPSSSFDWDFNIPKKEIFKEIFRVSKNQVIFGGNNFASYLPNSSGWICWDKMNGLSYWSDFELVFTSFQKGARFFKHKTVIINRQHPTQKPVALGEWILNKYSKKDDIILDCFAGSGSFLVACERLGRRWLGCEISQEYINIANARIEAERQQLKLPI